MTARLKRSDGRQRVLWSIAVMLGLAACGVAPEVDAEPPPPKYRSPSNLQVFDLNGARREVDISVIPAIVISQTGKFPVTEAALTRSTWDAIYAGELNTGAIKDSALWKCNIVCIGLTEDDFVWVRDKLYLTLNNGPGFGYPGAGNHTRTRSGVLDGGRSDDFVIEFLTGGTAQMELFNTDGPEGNGLTYVTTGLIFYSTVNPVSLDVSSRAWGTLIAIAPPSTDPSRSDIATYAGEMVGLYQPDPGTFHRVDGVAALAFDFSRTEFSGRISNISGDGQTLPDIVLAPAGEGYDGYLIYGGSASSDLSGYVGTVGAMEGTYSAALYGGGVEAGGVLAMSNDRESLVGAFTGAD